MNCSGGAGYNEYINYDYERNNPRHEKRRRARDSGQVIFFLILSILNIVLSKISKTVYISRNLHSSKLEATIKKKKKSFSI